MKKPEPITSPLSPLCKRIEVEISRGEPEIPMPNGMALQPQDVGIDSTVIRHIEELLEEIELHENTHLTTQQNEEDFTSVFKKVIDIERKLKRFEAESMALKKLLQRLN